MNCRPAMVGLIRCKPPTPPPPAWGKTKQNPPPQKKTPPGRLASQSAGGRFGWGSADGRKVPGLLGCLEGLLKHLRKTPPVPVCVRLCVCVRSDPNQSGSLCGGGGGWWYRDAFTARAGGRAPSDRTARMGNG